MRNALKQIFLIGLVMTAMTVQAVTYEPYRGKGLYLNTDRLEHTQFSTAVPMGSGGAVGTTTSGGSKSSSVQNSGGGVAVISLPALTQHSKNVEAQAAAAATVSEDTQSGPRRVSPINPGEDDVEFPVGDGVWVLLFLALCYGALRLWKVERVRE